MTGSSPSESSVPGWGKQDDLFNEFGRRRMQRVLEADRLAFCSPVYASRGVRRAVLCLISAAAALYIYFAVFPPAFIHVAARVLNLPTFMGHVIVGVVPILLACFTWRGQLARRFMIKARDEAPSILNDVELVAKVLRKPAGDARIFFNVGGCRLPALVLACLIVFKLLIPELHFFYSVAFFLPAAVLVALSLGGGGVISDVIKLSHDLVEALCRRLEGGLKEPAEGKKPVSETRAETQDAHFWHDITQQHLAMDEKLEKLWLIENAGQMLLADVTCRVVIILYAVFITLVSERLCVQVAGLFATCLGAVHMLQFLTPVAEVTSLCQCRDSNTRSIVRLAVKFVNHPRLSEEAKAGQSRFLHYISLAPAGIELPFLGLITIATLTNAAKVVAAVGPTVLTFMLKSRGA